MVFSVRFWLTGISLTALLSPENGIILLCRQSFRTTVWHKSLQVDPLLNGPI